MFDSKLKLVRDILIIVCIIVLAILVYVFRSGKDEPERTINLGDDLADMQDGPAMMHGIGGHSIQIFPEDTEGVVAVALDQDITWAELHRKANWILGPMASGLEGLADDEDVRINLKRQALVEILERMYISYTVEELGFNIEEIGDEALNEWAEGYNSPEEKLAEINHPGVTVDDQRRLLTREAIRSMVKETVTKEMTDATPTERENYYRDWLTTNILALEIDFRDSELEASWQEYVEFLSTLAGDED